jgi:hypothetical protein
MEKILTGVLKGKGLGVAGSRLKDCEKVLNKYGFFFPPLYFGTLNISLDQPFPTPASEGIFISQEEIDQVAPGGAEWWRLIPINSVNGKKTTGFIYRTRQNCYGDGVAELVTEDLSSWGNIRVNQGESIKIIAKIEKST